MLCVIAFFEKPFSTIELVEFDMHAYCNFNLCRHNVVAGNVHEENID